MNTWIILPTYNEKENITNLLQALQSLAIPSLSIVAVDDGSPDGTGHVLDSLRDQLSILHVLHRQKKLGLASAYVAGFRYALERGAEFLFEMDADGSHAPAAVPGLLQRAREADLVLGSRYIMGGRIENWNWVRRIVSRLGNWYARGVLGVPVRDLTGGFKCFRRATLETIGLETVSSTGYNFQIEMTVKALAAGLRVIEHPIVFTERRYGRSKFHFGIIFESMVGVWRLRKECRDRPRRRAVPASRPGT